MLSGQGLSVGDKKPCWMTNTPFIRDIWRALGHPRVGICGTKQDDSNSYTEYRNRSNLFYSGFPLESNDPVVKIRHRYGGQSN